MNCNWCGEWRGVRLVTVHPTIVTRCNAVSPFDPRTRCRRARGHDGACQADAADAQTALCFRCWGVFKETGKRPPRFRMSEPAVGPISGTPLDLRRLP